MKIIKLSASNVMRLKAVEIEPNGTVQIITGKNGAGKAQPVTEPVLTPDGWMPIGDIQPGDEVVGVMGTPVRVLGVYPQEGREVWEVSFADGTSVRCSPDHLWTVSSWMKGNSGWLPQTLTTAQIVEQGLRIRDGARKWAVPLVAPIQRALLPLPIEPYALGVILGDAHVSDTGYVQLSTDTEIIDSLGIDGYRRPSRGCEVLGSGEWAFRLQSLGLAGKRSQDKFVPADYLMGSVEQRTALLAGLLDTDGSPVNPGSSEFGSTSLALVEAVAELTRSLGGVATISGPKVKHYTYLGERKTSKLGFWSVRVRTEFNPFRLARKRELWKEPNSRRRVLRLIDSIRRVGDEDTVCIRVDSEDGLYVTRNYVVTHNTSLLNALYLALAGGAASREIAKPIRAGEEWAEVKLDLGTILVTRTWDEAGTKLTVKYPDGATQKSPQTLLDSLIGHISFDPLAFTRMAPRAQRQALLELLGLDFSAADAERQRLYDTREDTGRRKRGYGALPKLPKDAPMTEVSAQKILTAISQAQDAQRVIEQTRTNMRVGMEMLDDIDRQIKALTERRERVADTLAEETATLDGLKEPADIVALRAELDGIEDRNKVARDNQRIAANRDAQKQLEEEYTALSHQIDAIDASKAAAIAAADMPVSGLGFDSDGVTFGGVPFSQASSAEQIRVSMAMAMAMNPDPGSLQVIRIMDGSLLDADSMAEIKAAAEEHDVQVFIEVVGDGGGDPTAIVISDGEVMQR